MPNLFITPLGPGIALLLGAVVASMIRPRSPRWLPLGVSLAAIASAGGLLAWLVLSQQPTLFAWEWEPVALPGGQWLARLNGWALLSHMLLLLLGGVALMLGWDPGGRGKGPSPAGTLVLVSVGCFFVLSGNLLTLAASWVVLEIALAMPLVSGGRQAGARSWGLRGLRASLMLAALLFAGPSASQQALGADSSSLSLLALLMVALLLCGVYPAHLRLLPRPEISRGGQMLQLVVATIPGVWLLGWVEAQTVGQGRSETAWAALGVLSMLVGGVAAWLESKPKQRVGWVVVSRLGLAVAVAGLSEGPGEILVAWTLVTIALGGAGLIIGQAIRRRWGWWPPLALATLSLIGLPGTVAFPALTSLSPLVTSSLTMLPLAILGIIGETLFVAALLSGLWRPQAPAASPLALRQAIWLLLAAVLVAVPPLIWGLWPALLARTLGAPATETLAQSLPLQISLVRPAAWATLSVPWVLGVVLAWARGWLESAPSGWSDRVRRLLRLEWAYSAVGWGAERLTDLVRGASAVIEGEGYFGWLGLGALVVWLLWRS